MNIVVICSDTFRYDHLGFVGRQKVLTPNLDALARESARFDDFWLCSFPTLLNRMEVFSGRVVFPFTEWGRQPLHFPILSQVFQRHGFTTALIADNPHLMKENFDFERGFHFVKDVPGQMDDRFQPDSAPMIDLPCPIEKLDPRPRRIERYRRNAYWYQQRGTNTTETVFREAMHWLDSPPEKIFLWIDSFDPHEPWDAPVRYRESYPWNSDGDAVIWPRGGKASRYSDADLENIRTLYKAEATQSDFWIGQLKEHLRGRKLLDNTVLIFCSDHGFYFGEHGLLGKLSNRKTTRPTTIYEELGHIPLLLRHPAGIAAGQTIRGLCQPLDLFPTLLELAGIPQVEWTQGCSLVSRLHGQPGAQTFAVGGCYPREDHVSCTTVLTDEWHFIYSPYDGLTGSELYHRPTDPMHTQNVIAAHRDIAKEHFELLESWLKKLGVPESNQRQLLQSAGFGWMSKIKSRFRKFRNQRFYYKHYRNYAEKKSAN
jgi:arylsulfatase A-like enzyme